MLVQQLQPSGKFGLDSTNIHSTGNGSMALVEWLSTKEAEKAETDHILGSKPEQGDEAREGLLAFNVPPPLHRGISWAASPERTEMVCFQTPVLLSSLTSS